MVKRILATIVLLFSVLFLPFPLTVILAFAGMVYFPLYIEAIVLFLLSDLLFGTADTGLLDIPFMAFILSAIALFMIEIFKQKLKFYP